MSIFVSIAAYRDTETPNTVQSCIKNADHPENLHIGLVQQCQRQEVWRVPWADNSKNPHIESIWFPSKLAKGAGWARAHAQSMYRGEDWFLQIDSHTRFDQGWDTKLIDINNQASALAERPVILSAFPKAYIREGSQDVFYASEKYPDHPTKQEILWAGKRVWSAARVEFNDQSFSKPEESQTLLAGFIFAPGSIVKDVPYDPLISFFGEELCYTIRAWTRGYRIYSPQEALLSHFYTRRNHHKVWDAGNNVDKKWGGIEKQSMDRQASIYRGDIIGPWGAVSKESLKEYYDFVGLDIAGVYDSMLSDRKEQSKTYKEADIFAGGIGESVSLLCIDNEHNMCGVYQCECQCHQ